MTGFQETLGQVNAWCVHAQQVANAYFQECSPNELYAWGAEGIGLILAIVGTVLL